MHNLISPQVAASIAPGSIDDTLKERGNRYGSFTRHAKITQHIYDALTVHADVTGLTLSDSQREALHMICHKLGRIVNGDPNYDDSWRDIAGYATLIVKELNNQPT